MTGPVTVDVVDGTLPLPLGGGNTVQVAPTDVDVLVENVPFWLAIDQDNPYQRQTAPYRKEQADTQPEAGENSIQAWWLRSQMSFHAGAGLRYLDTQLREDEFDRIRFRDSRGVDCWTPGVVRRLNGTALARNGAAASRGWLATTVDPGTGADWLVRATDAVIERYDGTTWTALTRGDTNPIQGFCIDGANWYAASSTGVWKGPISGGAPTQLYAYTDGADALLGWVKARLMLALGQQVYELDCNAAASSALPTAALLHPTTGWRWVAFCETPNGIGMAGRAGLTSMVYKMELSDVSGVPTLGAAVVMLTLPPGEIVNDADLYLGSQLILATNRGIRVSTFQSYFGTVTLGPLVQAVGDGVALNVTALGCYDRFVFGGTFFDGSPALMRVDLGVPLDQAGHYPWAADLLLPPGAAVPAGAAVAGVAFRPDGRKFFDVPGYGTVAENTAPDANQPAWLETARVRVGSVEDKHWAHGVVRGAVSADAPITVETTGPGGAWAQVYKATTNGDRFDLKTAKGEWLALRFTLGGAAELNSYVLQTLPGGRRQRLLAVPVWLVDHQTTRSGLACGYDGWAADRLAALETIESAGAEVTLLAPALFAEAVRGVIEQLTFTQPVDPGDRGSTTGGRLVIQLRTTS